MSVVVPCLCKVVEVYDKVVQACQVKSKVVQGCQIKRHAMTSLSNHVTRLYKLVKSKERLYNSNCQIMRQGFTSLLLYQNPCTNLQTRLYDKIYKSQACNLKGKPWTMPAHCAGLQILNIAIYMISLHKMYYYYNNILL